MKWKELTKTFLTISNCEKTFASHGLHIEFQCLASADKNITGDHPRIFVIIWNLNLENTSLEAGKCIDQIVSTILISNNISDDKNTGHQFSPLPSKHEAVN